MQVLKAKRSAQVAPSRVRLASTAALAFGLLALGAKQVATDGPDLDGTRSILEEMVETQRLISKERRDWALGKQLLDDRIQMIRGEIESLKARTEEARKSITEADTKRLELVAENEKLKEASEELKATVSKLEGRTKELLVRLPAPIQARVKPLSQSLPEDSEEAENSLSERFMNVVGILNDVNRFNREITVTSEVRKLADGSSAEVAAFYVGLGQAYYLNQARQVAGVGSATADSWVWTEANDAAEAIGRAIAILKGDEIAGFVPLPVTLK